MCPEDTDATAGERLAVSNLLYSESSCVLAM